jgi:hypothetical protein
VKPGKSICGAPASARNQRECILRALVDAQGDWVPLPQIAALAQQYNARVYELRRSGFCIENKSETNEATGERHSWFRLINSVGITAPPPSRHAQDWKDRPRLTGLPLFDLGFVRE